MAGREKQIDVERCVVRAQSGDPEAFETLYQTHRNYVRAIVRRNLGPDQVDDISQDVFIKVWKGLPYYQRQEEGFLAWLRTITTNTCHSYYLKSSRRPTIPLETANPTSFRSPSPASPEEQFLVRERWEETRRAIGDLAPREVGVLTLDVNDVPQREIAQQMGISYVNTRVVLLRAREKLRKKVEPNQ